MRSQEVNKLTEEKRRPGDPMCINQERKSKRFLFKIFMTPELVRTHWHLINAYYVDMGIYYESPEIFVSCARNRDVFFYGTLVVICDNIFIPQNETEIPAEKIFRTLEGK